MLGVHVIIDLSSHLSPVIQSVLLHRPSIVQVRPFRHCARCVCPVIAVNVTWPPPCLRSTISAGSHHSMLLTKSGAA